MCAYILPCLYIALLYIVMTTIFVECSEHGIKHEAAITNSKLKLSAVIAAACYFNILVIWMMMTVMSLFDWLWTFCVKSVISVIYKIDNLVHVWPHLLILLCVFVITTFCNDFESIMFWNKFLSLLIIVVFANLSFCCKWACIPVGKILKLC